MLTVIARKWRPKDFTTLVGQPHVVKALTHALDNDRVHHAYLFTGTRGVGKTTVARILSKALNCQQGVSSRPCLTCSNCLAIDQGQFIDVFELDAATHTGVDDMRQLLENASYAPSIGRYKVYIIDEVHMLSTSAFNAMLKSLEEPPEHVRFILATTDPQKVPITVLSRCLQFNLRNMASADMVTHMTHILAEDGINCSPSALLAIAKAAAGSMRDALSILDQAISHGDGQVDDASVEDMLGIIGRDALFATLEALVNNDVPNIMQLVTLVREHNVSADHIFAEMATLLTEIQTLQLAPSAMARFDNQPKIKILATQMDEEFIQMAYQIMIYARRDLPYAPDDETALSMTLLRLIAFYPSNKAPNFLTHKAAPSTDGQETPPTSRQALTVAPEVGVPSMKDNSTAADTPPTEAIDQPPSVVSAPPKNTTACAQQHEVANAQLAQTAELTPLARWQVLCKAIAFTGMAKELAKHCELRSINDQQICLRLAPEQSFLNNERIIVKMRDKLRTHFANEHYQLVLEVAAREAESIDEVQQVEMAHRLAEAVDAIEQDTYVQTLLDTCDGTIISNSIRYLGNET